MPTPIPIANRRELFVDDLLIDRLTGAARTLHEPQRREIVWQAERPWECSTCCYFHVFKDGDRVRMYHRGHCKADDDHAATANLIESTDGIHFTRPELGLIDFEGTKLNNVVFRGVQAHNLFVFRDENPTAPADQRYKAVGGGWVNLFGLVSPDGLRWRLIQDQPLSIKGKFDSLNVIMWDRHAKCYRAFIRDFVMEGPADKQDARRVILSTTSDDFIHWADPVPHQYAAGVPDEQFYTNATTPCPGAEHILLSFPKRFVPERTLKTEGMIYPGKGMSDAVFMSSRDGVHWDRSFTEAWVRPGLDERNWTHRSLMTAPGIIPTSPTEWSMYISEHYGWPTNRLRRLSLRPWGFASVRAGRSGGELLTKVMTTGAGELRLNYSTSAVGSVQVEVQDAGGIVIPGFDLASSQVTFGDELDGPIRWNSADFRTLAGRPIRLRIAIKDADVFSLHVAE